jgi:hypothetical protein
MKTNGEFPSRHRESRETKIPSRLLASVIFIALAYFAAQPVWNSIAMRWRPEDDLNKGRIVYGPGGKLRPF